MRSKSKSTSSSKSIRINPTTNANAQLKNEICSVCQQWKTSAMDFSQNFISCSYCRHSYHRRCIVFRSHSQHKQSHSCCHQFADERMPTQALRCQDADVEDTSPQLLVEITSEKFNQSYYIEHNGDDDDDDDADTVYFDALQVSKQTLATQHHPKKVFSRWKTSKIQYKGITYRIGDCVEVRNERISPHEFDTNVGIIQRIHVFDEHDVDALPTLDVFWFWRETELRRQLCQYTAGDALLRIPNESAAPFMDHHLFCDIECATAGVSMAAVCHKVLICDSFSAFLETQSCKFTGFGNVCFSTHTYTSGDYEKYKRSPFAAMSQAVFVQNLISGFKQEQKQFGEHRVRVSANKMRANSIEKVRKFLDTYALMYDPNNNDDEVQCMAENAPLELRHEGGGGGGGELKEMQSVCTALGIPRIKHEVALYGFADHLAVYTEIKRLVKMDSDCRRKAHVLEMSSMKLRDIKVKIFCEGKIRKQEMIENIVKKLVELRKYYYQSQASSTNTTTATTTGTRKRKQMEEDTHLKTNGPSFKRQRI